MVDEASGDGGNADYELTHVHKCGVGTGGQWVAVRSSVLNSQASSRFRAVLSMSTKAGQRRRAERRGVMQS